MARMTKKLVHEIARWTNKCYKDAVIELNKDLFSGMTPKHLEKMTERDCKEILLNNGRNIRSEEINQLYCTKIRTLSTNQLKLIVEAHNKEKFIRAAHTIEIIIDELFQRAVIPESKD